MGLESQLGISSPDLEPGDAGDPDSFVDRVTPSSEDDSSNPNRRDQKNA